MTSPQCEPDGAIGKIEVRVSTIDGRGVFALAEFRRGQLVGELWGKVISVTEANRRASRRRRIAIVELDEAIAIDAARSKSRFRYINHSCEPNTVMRIGDGWVRFYAKRIIKPAEELTCDYGESHHEGTLPCQCGTPRCRGFL
jgi:SET domain-containing protein